jgi:hypothetical protein
MITPSTVDIIDIIGTAIDDAILPDAVSVNAKSNIATVRHLLRHVRERILKEGQILTDDITAQRTLLAKVEAWLRTEAPKASCLTEVQNALSRQYRAEGQYPDLLSLAEEAGALRWALTHSLSYLVAQRDKYREDPSYQVLRENIREYTVNQIRSEAPLIEPAFKGRGPRR